MDNWLPNENLIRKAFEEQHHNRLLQTAARERLLRQAKEINRTPIRNQEVEPVYKRKLVLLTSIIIAFSVLIIVAAL